MSERRYRYEAWPASGRERLGEAAIYERSLTEHEELRLAAYWSEHFGEPIAVHRILTDEDDGLLQLGRALFAARSVSEGARPDE